ncbi:MAG: preprotein translocase subunit SecG, partial [Pseudomonadota bacterium]
MLLHILLVIHIIVCVFLIGFVLMQQSEGGALGMGGGPSGFMTARGAGNFMTRMTWILFAVFLVLSIILTLIAGRERASNSVLGRG